VIFVKRVVYHAQEVRRPQAGGSVVGQFPVTAFTRT
jgi:hypothetical protein